MDKEYLQQIGAKIKAERNRQGLYLKDLAELCDMHYSHISFIENGKANFFILTLKRIADELGVDVKEFL